MGKISPFVSGIFGPKIIKEVQWCFWGRKILSPVHSPNLKNHRKRHLGLNSWGGKLMTCMVKIIDTLLLTTSFETQKFNNTRSTPNFHTFSFLLSIFLLPMTLYFFGALALLDSSRLRGNRNSHFETFQTKQNASFIWASNLDEISS